MHSFKARNNRIVWKLVIEGEIPKWPDVKESHELVVRAPERSSERDAELTGDRYEPGSVLERTIEWAFEQEPERIEVRLVWYTVGKGDQDLSMVDMVEIEPAQRLGSRQVRFDLPEGPFSYSGRLIAIHWALDVIAFPSLESRRIEIVVGPEGREIDL